MKKIMITVCFLAAAFAIVARAEDGGKKGSGPCKADVEKFCKDIKPGEGRIIKCMKEHESELSEACKATRGEKKEAMREGIAACREDIQSKCSGVKPGEGRIIKCLKEHEADLKPACRDSVSQNKPLPH